MLDSAPPAPLVPSSAAEFQLNAQVAAQLNAQINGQTNAQMHLGIRTDAFGAVEIHTVVQQSQVGISVHSDRDIARWFSSEVPSLESGLNNSHLNLTAVHFDSGRSGVQTSTGFQQGQSRQHFAQTPGSAVAGPAAALPENGTASESTTADVLPADLSVGPGSAHVSIHV